MLPWWHFFLVSSSIRTNLEKSEKCWKLCLELGRERAGHTGQGQYGGKSGGEQGSLQSLLLKGSLWGPLREFTWARAHCWAEWIGEDSYDRATGRWADAGVGHVATAVPRMGFRSLQHPPPPVAKSLQMSNMSSMKKGCAVEMQLRKSLYHHTPNQITTLRNF